MAPYGAAETPGGGGGPSPEHVTGMSVRACGFHHGPRGPGSLSQTRAPPALASHGTWSGRQLGTKPGFCQGPA